MSNECERMRDEIAGQVTGQDTEQLRLHLDSCAACRDYLQALQREDAALAGYFAAVEADMTRRQERLRQAIECADTSKRTDGISIWRGIMNSRLPKAAVAAAILLAIALSIRHLGGRLDGTSVAWAGVARKLSQIKDYTYRQRQINSSGVKEPGFEFRNEWETRWYFSSDFGHRWDQYHAGELSSQYYVLLKKQQHVWLHPHQKTFHCRTDQLPETMSLDPAGAIRAILAEPYVKLGRTTMDGRVVEGIEVQGQKVSGPRLDNAVSRLWVDVETELPVWMESEGRVHGANNSARLIQDQFRWNAGLTEADFTPVIPPDFQQEDWPAENNTKQPDIAIASTVQKEDVNFGPLQEFGLLSNDPAPSQPTRALTGMAEIHMARDEVMRAWPKYAELREALRQELNQKVNLESRPAAEMVQLAVLLREKYWDVGGDLSPTSYRYGYMARMLLEAAHAREPNDLAIGDELAETIMSIETMRVGGDFWPVLHELRAAQFRQARAEVETGRAPVWEDFARGCDLINLLSVDRPEEAVPVVEWLMSHAQAGGWTGYGELLEWIRPKLAQKGGLGYNIYRPAEFPEEFRYGDRLPSFRGPRKRAAVPSFPLQPKTARVED